MDVTSSGCRRQMILTGSSLNNTNYSQVMTTKHQKRKDALGLFVESVIKPDPALRQCAHNQECYNELMEWRQDILDYLSNRRKEEFGR